jgi:hypothetical protein
MAEDMGARMLYLLLAQNACAHCKHSYLVSSDAAFFRVETREYAICLKDLVILLSYDI